jgi:hypothetical protein
MRFGSRTRGGVVVGVVVLGVAAGAISLASADAARPLVGRWGQTGAATAGAGEAETASAPLAGATTITVIDDGAHGQSNFVDTPPHRRPNAGDYFVFEDPVLSTDGSQTVGLVDGQCTLAFAKGICTATLHLNGRGKISVVGTSPAANGPFLLPIAGGTSEFAGARGQVLVSPAGHGNSTLTVYLLP